MSWLKAIVRLRQSEAGCGCVTFPGSKMPCFVRGVSPPRGPLSSRFSGLRASRSVTFHFGFSCAFRKAGKARAGKAQGRVAARWFIAQDKRHLRACRKVFSGGDAELSGESGRFGNDNIADIRARATLQRMGNAVRDTVTNVTVAVLEAATLGSIFGTVGFLGAGAFFASAPWSVLNPLIFLPAVLLVSFFALVIVLPSTALFGGLSALVLARLPRSAAMAAVVLAAGGLLGWAVWTLIQGDRPGVGIFYGAVTGLFWYLRFPRLKVDAD